MKYVIFILLLIICRTATSQSVDGFKYHAVYIPSGFAKNITIDGHTKEWDWVPAQYKLRMHDLLGSEHIDSSDLDVEYFVAWSDITNKVYIIAKVDDDIINSDGLNQDDGLDININTNKISGEYWPGDNYRFLFFNIFSFSLGTNSLLENVYIYYGPHWLLNKNYLNFAVSIEKNKKRNMFTVYYEIEFNLWQYLSLYSSQLSKPEKLKAGSEFGLTIAFNDVDKNIYLRDDRPRTFSGDNYMQKADAGSCFILDAPCVASNLYDDLLLLNLP